MTSMNQPPAQLPLDAATHDLFRDDEIIRPGFFAQLIMAVFQPQLLFRRYIPVPPGSQRSSVVALLILFLLAFSAVRYAEQAPLATSSSSGADVPFMDMGALDSGDMFSGGMPADFGMDMGGGAETGSGTSDIGDTWTIALKAAGAMVLQWLVLSVVLAEVTMFNGRAPRFGTNLQVAVWASIPLALMAILQLIFMAGGGVIGQPGLAGFLSYWEAFGTWNIYVRSFVHGLLSQATLFGFWSLLLVWIGARQTLRGKWFAVLLTLAVWVVMLGIGYGFRSYAILQVESAETADMSMDADMMWGDNMASPDMGMIPEGDSGDNVPADGETETNFSAGDGTALGDDDSEVFIDEMENAPSSDTVGPEVTPADDAAEVEDV